jgi:hypothetical protein
MYLLTMKIDGAARTVRLQAPEGGTHGKLTGGTSHGVVPNTDWSWDSGIRGPPRGHKHEKQKMLAFTLSIAKCL